MIAIILWMLNVYTNVLGRSWTTCQITQLFLPEPMILLYSVLITKLVSHTWLFSSWIDYPSQQVSYDQSSLAKDSPLSI